ncbi:MAG: sugar transferase [Sedimentisphaerales bacterium]|nr:sugar transferase [Sedimentisphaerales bacterium]
MNLIIFHRDNISEKSSLSGYLRFALTDNHIAHIVIDGFGKYSAKQKGRVSILRSFVKRSAADMIYAVPKEWSVGFGDTEYRSHIVPYNNHIQIPSSIIDEVGRKDISDKRFVISNGRFLTKINENLLERVLDKISADVISINADPGLLGQKEKVRLIDNNTIVGFRRFYSDSAKLCPVPYDWPAHLFVKPDVFEKLLTGSSLTLSFSEMMERCKANYIKVCAADVGGAVLDLEKEDALLQFVRLELGKKADSEFSQSNSITIADDSKLAGKVLLGKNVQIGSNAVIIGPTVIGDNVVIEEGSVIYSSIIGSDIVIPDRQSIRSRIINEQYGKSLSGKDNYLVKPDCLNLLKGVENGFRNWPKFSYAKFLKRIADIAAAIIVLTLFVPLFPFIAVVIKLSSTGPVFYLDKRQGLHGKEFHCLKFRTMITGANEIQDNLRFVSQVDGPQFKMDNDPRISIVGRFLRETYVDEIPQFFNVLFGQMSIVGPRPSPESENTLCPFWRDARLSVKPGITGLWQICRTRRSLKDFQEWIYYDIEYVKKLSLKTDLKICWKTVKKLLDTFISQF